MTAATILKLLMNPSHPKLPISTILIYPALDLNFTYETMLLKILYNQGTN